MITNPETLHDPVPFGYSHVAEVGDLVFVAGQYASGPDGLVTVETFEEQVELAFANLGTALKSAGLDYADVFQLRTYIVDHSGEKLEIVGGVLGRLWGGRPPVQTMLGVAALALPEMRFEVDAIAIRRS
ncbi:enamine deaminase RidA (YjgF/YER057c/UK114 family) [Kribbella amoyensis]|uniref:Enamine deaminase RidA (YjgF/YER057c/UK114 family) n=1 Tax=Kribbella amoyensis TaxID=996641 RepID=A0A561B867_9ACTN|nr:RidA family protein [Kribbella amoyensis]TWD74967.1 enamine deaminase RidA (YjgF/YER057c/UK114 family) [Kribbella amoyensis]